MAEGLLFSAAEMMLQTLGSAAMEEIGLLWGVDNEFESLLDTLLAIKAVLRDAEKKKKAGNEQVKFWLERLENVVSEADDMLDEVATEKLRRQVMPGKNEIVKKVRTFFSSSNQAAFRRKMAHKIKHIREKLDRIAAIRERFHLEESYEEILSVGRMRESHSSLGEDDLDLRVVEKENIVKLLLNPNQNSTQQEKLSVLPIVGMGGLGKTTLAKLVYNDKRVLNHFELRAWVCVSDNFDQKLLIEKIFDSITIESNAKDKRMEELQDLLQKKINDKRYLLVLDDVWNENPQEWQGLKGLLKYCGEGSRIIVTTRSEKVANTTGTMEPYPLKILDGNKPWSLFSKIAFEGGKEPTDKQIASEIVGKCNGVPLAITMIGSLIRSRGKNINWEHFHGSELSDMIPGEENSVFVTTRSNRP